MGTESRHPRSIGLDKMTSHEIVRLMAEEEAVVNRAFMNASDAIAQAAQKAADAYQVGGRVIYVGAGTSGRIATMDAAEMVPTFGLNSDRFVAIVAGGPGSGLKAIEDAEDDEHAAVQALNDIALNRKDIVIALAASGRTPFVVAAAKHARQKGVWTCGIANNKKVPLFDAVDLPLLLDTGPELLTGSTRLKAATAQKLALNAISTAAMVLSGKVVENLMVDVRANNQKLRERSVRIVHDLTTISESEAERVLSAHNWNVRQALSVLLANTEPVH